MNRFLLFIFIVFLTSCSQLPPKSEKSKNSHIAKAEKEEKCLERKW